MVSVILSFVLCYPDFHLSETCIKGHRSSNCQHTDRPLYEIKKKGRPVTQCEHCRELRKTKQLHIRCICGTKDSTSTPSTSRTGKKKGVYHYCLPLDDLVGSSLRLPYFPQALTPRYPRARRFQTACPKPWKRRLPPSTSALRVLEPLLILTMVVCPPAGRFLLLYHD